MKRILTTIFIFLYFFSALGYTSIQHYCQMMQNTVQSGSMACCCSAEEPDDDNCHVEIQQAPTSCCDAEQAQGAPLGEERYLTTTDKNCCETKTDYKQIDPIPLSYSNDMQADITELENDILVCERSDFHSSHNVIPHSDPSHHINTPLII